MADIVLVHGGNMSTQTWNRLTVGNRVLTEDGSMGARYWEGTVAVLSAHNHRVFAPTLTDELTGSLIGHIEEISAVIIENNLHNFVIRWLNHIFSEYHPGLH